MSGTLEALIMEIVPADGSAIGNQNLLTALRQRRGDVSDEAYHAARNALLAAGKLGKGRGRGGSVFRLDTATDPDEASDDAGDESADDEDADVDEDEPFSLIHTEEAVPEPRKSKGIKRTKATKSGNDAQVVSYRHMDKRVNNPEVGMVHPENDPGDAPEPWAYDPHIDPALQFDIGRAQIENLIDGALESGDADRMREALAELKRMQAPYLAWTGKAERTSFEVDTVSLHVHERIDPASILSAVRKKLKGGKEVPLQYNLYEAPFESLPLRQALDFYKHEKNWSNRLIAGDSLLVMNSLIHKEGMAGQVQMIYIDPPYGIKYGSNFQPFTSKRDVKDGADADLTQEPEMIKAFRDTWELGIHSYLTYLRDRLLLARELLHDSGSIFIQISDENLHHIRELADEIFGENNFLSIISIKKTGGATSDGLPTITDYIVWYAKNKKNAKYNPIFVEKSWGGDGSSEYFYVEKPSGAVRTIPSSDIGNLDIIHDGELIFATDSGVSDGYRVNTSGKFEWNSVIYNSGLSKNWKATFPGMLRIGKSGRLIPRPGLRIYKRYFDDFPYQHLNNVWFDVRGALGRVYVVQTSEKVIERCVLMATDPGDLVMDPTCGSGTSAFVAEKWGRRWITCDTSRVAVTLAKQRLMTASFDYYALRYPHEGLKGGFMYKTAPHITLKSIANNPDIDDIYARMHPTIVSTLEALNSKLTTAPPFKPAHGVRKGQSLIFAKGETLEDWEVPFDWPEAWPATAKPTFEAFHTARRAMRRAMDQSIADHAEAETLYDKPEIEPSKLRITGPFSIEAVPNPTVLALDETLPAAEADVAVARSGETSRQTLWRDELIKTGIRGKAGQMLRLTELEAIPGLRYLHASGSMAESGERVVVSFGPEHAALEQRQVELALTEAEKLRPAPKFVIFCAFTFDPEAAKDIDEVTWRGVTLLKVQMNTDLLTEDLKKARASNQSFWLMGQPDVDVRKRADGRWEVEVNGFDYFDPKAGELVSGGKKQIAMWSLDTDYDQRSLFPHQVFFPMAGAKEGWNRLKKTIRAELNEDLLEHFHGTVSLPFPAGDNACVAIKIVDDRGIESLKIVPLDA